MESLNRTLRFRKPTLRNGMPQSVTSSLLFATKALAVPGHAEGLHAIRMDGTGHPTILYRIMIDCQRPWTTRIPDPDQDSRQTEGQVSGKKPTAKVGAKITSISCQPRRPPAESCWWIEAKHFDGAGGGRLASRRHAAAASRQPVTSASVTTYTTSADAHGSLRADPRSKLRGQPRQLRSQQHVGLASRDAVTSCTRLMPPEISYRGPVHRRVGDRPSRDTSC
jgi:hypothetical protein